MIWQVLLNLFYVAWLLAVLVFLWLIWRDSVRRAVLLDKTLINATLSASEAARQSAETARLLATRQEKEGSTAA